MNEITIEILSKDLADLQVTLECMKAMTEFIHHMMSDTGMESFKATFTCGPEILPEALKND